MHFLYRLTTKILVRISQLWNGVLCMKINELTLCHTHLTCIGRISRWQTAHHIRAHTEGLKVTAFWRYVVQLFPMWLQIDIWEHLKKGYKVKPSSILAASHFIMAIMSEGEMISEDRRWVFMVLGMRCSNSHSKIHVLVVSAKYISCRNLHNLLAIFIKWFWVKKSIGTMSPILKGKQFSQFESKVNT